MKKYTLTCLPLICTAIVPLCADSNGNDQQMSDKKMSKKSKGMSQSMREITPPAPALATHWADPFVTAEYIYWKAEETGLQYAVSGLAPSATTTTDEHGSIHDPDFHYDSGFKVGVGLKFKHDGWDLYANYTWLFSDGNGSSVEREDGEESLQPLYNVAYDGSSTASDMAKAEGDWSLHFNVLDVELGRNFFISPRLTLRPHFGLKFAWLDQDMQIEYEDAKNFANSSINELHHHFDEDQFGVGIRTGLNTAWYMWNKWSIFGNFAATALYSDFDTHRKTEFQNAALGKNTLMHFSYDPHIITPVLEFALGLRFETNFSKSDHQFMIQAGWEEQIWFDENQFTNLTRFSTSGNLTLQGLTVKAGYAF